MKFFNGLTGVYSWTLRVTKSDTAYLQKASDIEDYFRDFFSPHSENSCTKCWQMSNRLLGFCTQQYRRKTSHKCRKMSLDSHQNQSWNWWTSDFCYKPMRSQSHHLIKIILPVQKWFSSQMDLNLLPLQLKHWKQLWHATWSLCYSAWGSSVRIQRWPISTHYPPLYNKVEVTRNHLDPSRVL